MGRCAMVLRRFVLRTAPVITTTSLCLSLFLIAASVASCVGEEPEPAPSSDAGAGSDTAVVADSGNVTNNDTGVVVGPDGGQEAGTTFCATTGSKELFCADFDRSSDVAAEWSPKFLLPDQTVAGVELDPLAASLPRSARMQLGAWPGAPFGAQARLIKDIPPRSTTDKRITFAADVHVKSTPGSKGTIEILRLHIEDPPGTDSAAVSLSVQWDAGGGPPLWYLGFTESGGGAASSAQSSALALDQWVKINMELTLGQVGAFTMRFAGLTAAEKLNINWSVSSNWQTSLIIGPAVAASPTLGTIIYYDNVVLNTAP